jgi:broad specificity phosphatase PhoE
MIVVGIHPLAPMRCSARRALLVAAVLIASVVLSGCGTGGSPVAPVSPVSPAPTAGATPTTLVMIIRHGEKPDDSTSGVDEQGKEDDSSLTEVGWDRARHLVDLFDPAQGPPRPGLGRPTTIYAAGANDDGEGQRTRETVMPLADKLGITVNTSFGKGDEKALVKHVISHPGPTLISWQHGELPNIAEAFPSVTPTPPSEWPDDRFDVVWTLTKTAGGWHFAQLPEQLLPGDQASVIEN